MTPALLSAVAAASPLPVEVRPEILTTAPVDIGIGVLVEAGPRLRLATQIGLMPGPYEDGINGAIGWFVPEWTEEEQALVEAVVDGSLVWRTEAGWRFVPKLGLYAHGAYTFARLGGEATPAELVEAWTATALPDDPRLPVTERSYEASAALHLLGAEIGWDQRLWRSLHLRAGVGWSFTVASHTEIGPAFDPGPLAARAYDAAGTAAASYLDDTFQGYAHPPTVTLALGWAIGG